MTFCVVVVSGLVTMIFGPFDTREAAAQWIQDNQVKNSLIHPILSANTGIT